MAKKILVVGGGGREHAIIKALKKSPDCGEIWCAPGNGGISYDAKCKNIKATDVDTMVGFAVEEKSDYVVVAQDDPLALGMVDALAKAGIPAFGPDKAAARIEASKVFSKDLMKKYGIPTAKYETFDDPAKVMDYIRAEGKYPVVIKADGLALGKGVLICENEQQAADGVKEIMLDKKFGASGNHVVVEEFLTGPEVSVLSFTDGKVVKPMVSSMDHKRANDHDTGLNTGGMGTIAPNPYYTPEVAAECMEKIFLPTIHAMNAEGCPFKGCLYFGLMLTPDGPRSSSITAASATPKRRWCCRCWKATCCTSCRRAPTARWQSRRSNSPMVLRPVSFWLPAATLWPTRRASPSPALWTVSCPARRT